jgi:hypothetical protein
VQPIDIMGRFLLAAVVVVLAGYMLPVLIGTHPGDGAVEWIALTIAGIIIAVGAVRAFYLWLAGR